MTFVAGAHFSSVVRDSHRYRPSFFAGRSNFVAVARAFHSSHVARRCSFFARRRRSFFALRSSLIDRRQLSLLPPPFVRSWLVPRCSPFFIRDSLPLVYRSLVLIRFSLFAVRRSQLSFVVRRPSSFVACCSCLSRHPRTRPSSPAARGCPSPLAPTSSPVSSCVLRPTAFFTPRPSFVVRTRRPWCFVLHSLSTSPAVARPSHVVIRRSWFVNVRRRSFVVPRSSTFVVVLCRSSTFDVQRSTFNLRRSFVVRPSSFIAQPSSRIVRCPSPVAVFHSLLVVRRVSFAGRLSSCALRLRSPSLLEETFFSCLNAKHRSQHQPNHRDVFLNASY